MRAPLLSPPFLFSSFLYSAAPLRQHRMFRARRFSESKLKHVPPSKPAAAGPPLLSLSEVFHAEIRKSFRSPALLLLPSRPLRGPLLKTAIPPPPPLPIFKSQAIKAGRRESPNGLHHGQMCFDGDGGITKVLIRAQTEEKP